MPTYLDDIIAAHRARAAADSRDPEELVARVEEAIRATVVTPGGPVEAPTLRGFAGALAAAAADQGLAVIAEIKRRSPSKGDLDPTLDPAAVAADYQAGGASCLSVLTDAKFFGGSPEDLQTARVACALPVLRKDFTVSTNDICDARLMGADAVLLIAACLTDAELVEFLALAVRIDLDAIVEVHDRDELARALSAGAYVVGVNQRDLRTFEVDHERALELAASFPAGVVSVAESGIRGPEDAARLAEAGYQGVLVGESLIRSGDRRAAVADLVRAGSGVIR